MKYTAIRLVKRPDVHITPDLFETVSLQTPELKDGMTRSFLAGLIGFLVFDVIYSNQ